jgi:hypothetical protein
MLVINLKKINFRHEGNVNGKVGEAVKGRNVKRRKNMI